MDIFKPVLNISEIELLGDIDDLVPSSPTYGNNWGMKVFNRETYACKKYMPPNRRDFYKILFIKQGEVIITMSAQTYFINEPTMLFLHPNEICSWKNLSILNRGCSSGHYVLFQKDFLKCNPVLKSLLDRYAFFLSSKNNILSLDTATTSIIDQLFLNMHLEIAINTQASKDALLAYLQLIIIESVRAGHCEENFSINTDCGHIQSFFQLLEKEMSVINKNIPLRIRRAKEFANELALHPNYLNALLKTHTRRSLSTHLSDRLTDESKVLLKQTEWTLQQISYMLNFSDQSNFCRFFKNSVGQTPNEYRKSLLVI